MKAIIVIVILIAGFGTVAYLYQQDQAEKVARAEAAREEERSRVAAAAAQAERRAAEEAAKREAAKQAEHEETVSLLRRYLEREEKRLETQLAETKLKLEIVGEDQRRFAEEVRALESRNAKAGQGKEGTKRRDQIEKVRGMLKSSTLNRLALTYTGADFSALTAEFNSWVDNLVKLGDEESRRLGENRQRYNDAVQSADEEVDAKFKTAQRQLGAARKTLSDGVPKLEKELADVDRRVAELEKIENGKGRALTYFEKRDLKDLKARQAIIREQVNSRKDVAALGDANDAHLQASLAETAARRKYDTAIVRRQDEDNAVHSEINAERSYINIAANYQGRCVDRVGLAMRTYAARLADQIGEIQGKLEFLGDSASNLDLLGDEELKVLRQRIAERLGQRTLAGTANANDVVPVGGVGGQRPDSWEDAR